MSMVGKYFSTAEFACHDGSVYPSIWIPTRLVKLVSVLDVVRLEWGSAIHVRSGYRTPAWNAHVGGAKNSQHVEGRAADIYPNDLHDVDKLHELILGLYLGGRIPALGGLGKYFRRWTHVDVREQHPPGHLAQWDGSGIGSEK